MTSGDLAKLKLQKDPTQYAYLTKVGALIVLVQ